MVFLPPNTHISRCTHIYIFIICLPCSCCFVMHTLVGVTWNALCCWWTSTHLSRPLISNPLSNSIGKGNCFHLCAPVTLYKCLCGVIVIFFFFFRERVTHSGYLHQSVPGSLSQIIALPFTNCVTLGKFFFFFNLIFYCYFPHHAFFPPLYSKFFNLCASQFPPF